MALRNNKQLGISKLKQDVAANLRKSARTKYLPHISAVGTYQHTTRAISLLNDQQKAALPNLGTGIAKGMEPTVAGLGTSFAQMGAAFAQLGIPAQNVAEMLGGFTRQ